MVGGGGRGRRARGARLENPQAAADEFFFFSWCSCRCLETSKKERLRGRPHQRPYRLYFLFCFKSIASSDPTDALARKKRKGKRGRGLEKALAFSLRGEFESKPRPLAARFFFFLLSTHASLLRWFVSTNRGSVERC